MITNEQFPASRFSDQLIPAHAAYLSALIEKVSDDDRIEGVLGVGSMGTPRYDAFSDLDLVLVAADDAYDDLAEGFSELAGQLGELAVSFIDDIHPEPLSLICLYVGPTMQVDLKLLRLSAADGLLESPRLLWDRQGRVSAAIEPALETMDRSWPESPPAYFEERFWILCFYCIQKIGRGEIFDAASVVSLLRDAFVGPLLHTKYGGHQKGMRYTEELPREVVAALADTFPAYDRRQVLDALRGIAELYLFAYGEEEGARAEAREAVLQAMDDLHLQLAGENAGGQLRRQV